eukprot:3446451-Pleurochrysis_carterae.AAC.1
MEDVVPRHGKVVSSKYTSDVTTTRKPGTSTRNALGDWLSRPRLTPTQARESMRVLDTAGRGLTAYARHPKGIMPMMAGFSPEASS